MQIAQHRLKIATKGQGLYEVTAEVARWVEGTGLRDGLLTLYLPHTSASLLIQENAAPAVRADLADFLAALAPEDPRRYRHNEEGPDDMPAHIRAALLPVQLSIPLEAGRLVLGTWQGIYLVEHRRAPHRREIVLQLLGA
ncbi:MAG TPA: secondary thiamine-phosphate synthase enzyme YjbQ [Stellaceae bacterium]|nr:secondary thiamine-phosphate synthase enzyme YjbQ [Stellaceae bacterium]